METSWMDLLIYFVFDRAVGVLVGPTVLYDYAHSEYRIFLPFSILFWIS
jgi:hypothetical protein